MTMREEIVQFGLQMGVKKERMEEIFSRGQALGITTGTDAAWLKAIGDAPDMNPLEKTFLGFVIAGIIIGITQKRAQVSEVDEPLEEGEYRSVPNDGDPMFR
jgi:hypothetical protein